MNWCVYVCVLIVARFLRWLSNAIGGHNRINEITDSIFLVLYFIIYSNGRERSVNGPGPNQAGTNQYIHTYGVKVSYWNAINSPKSNENIHEHAHTHQRIESNGQPCSTRYTNRTMKWKHQQQQINQQENNWNRIKWMLLK